MSISVVSTVAVPLLLLSLSRFSVFGHVSSYGSCQTINSEGHVITEGLAPMNGRYKMTVKTAPTTQLGMAQAASDVKHESKNEAGEEKTAVEYKDTTTASTGTSDEAKTPYENAKKRVGEAHQTAKETMTQSAKEKYEEAKEKASKAAGDLGAKMREGKEEL